MTNSEKFEDVFGFDPAYLSFQEWLAWLDQPYVSGDET
jgi:hypothetical protein